MMARIDPPGPRVGVGRSADIYDLGHGRVLRRYHDHERSARGEAEVMSWAAAHGVPVPEVFGADGPDIVMEKVDGPTMLADLARRPWRLAGHAAALARLHEQVHAVPALDGLRAPSGMGGRAGEAVLLHLDLHPENVLMSARGPVIIDWEGAGRGPTEADVAVCWVVVATSEVPGSVRQQVVGRAGQRLFADIFLRRAGVAVGPAWLAEAARFRLLDPHLRPAEAARVRRVLARGGRAGRAPADPG
jgi:aminoglycoside phosphotransferase (APT) family kinase protein